MPFAAALSEHPSPAEATGEVVGAILDQLGPGPNLAALFVSPAMAGALEDIVTTIKATLSPGTLIGASASSIIGGSREVEQGPAIALWAAHIGPVTPVRLQPELTGDGVRVRGLSTIVEGDSHGTLLLLADPFSVPVDGILTDLAEDLPSLAVVGGMASAARGPGGNRLVLDGEIHRDGAVGVLLPHGVTVRPVVSQGCRPVGEPMIVTASDGPMLLGLAGRPALDRLAQIGREMSDEDRALFQVGPQIGIVVDESLATFGPGDFLIRNVLGADPDRNGVVIGDHVTVGTTVQFHVRDAQSADHELQRLLATTDGGAGGADGPGSARGALLFTCNGRGSPFFGSPDHDADLVTGSVGSAVAGMACAGEIGPIGGRSHLHGYTCSLLILKDQW